jgi:flagellar hook assembly protein FlgD
VPVESTVSSFRTEPEVFTPDNDGKDDYLLILYNLDDPGSLANVMIFDSRGKLVRRVANNSWLGEEGRLTWDGTNTEGTLARAGIYVVYMEILSEKGMIRKFTSTCVLSKEMK